MTKTPDDIAVRLAGVRLDRGGRTILSGIDLDVPRGSITAVLGPSGSGKSTLLAALTGELVPAAGTVEVLGQRVPQRQRALLELRKGIGVLLQGNGLLTDLTAAEDWHRTLAHGGGLGGGPCNEDGSQNMGSDLEFCPECVISGVQGKNQELTPRRSDRDGPVDDEDVVLG